MPGLGSWLGVMSSTTLRDMSGADCRHFGESKGSSSSSLGVLYGHYCRHQDTTSVNTHVLGVLGTLASIYQGVVGVSVSLDTPGTCKNAYMF